MVFSLGLHAGWHCGKQFIMAYEYHAHATEVDLMIFSIPPVFRLYKLSQMSLRCVLKAKY
jgi:hypothetical protein